LDYDIEIVAFDLNSDPVKESVNNVDKILIQPFR
jgi:hypothetical protein